MQKFSKDDDFILDLQGRFKILISYSKNPSCWLSKGRGFQWIGSWRWKKWKPLSCTLIEKHGLVAMGRSLPTPINLGRIEGFDVDSIQPFAGDHQQQNEWVLKQEGIKRDGHLFEVFASLQNIPNWKLVNTLSDKFWASKQDRRVTMKEDKRQIGILKSPLGEVPNFTLEWHFVSGTNQEIGAEASLLDPLDWVVTRLGPMDRNQTLLSEN